MKKISLSIVTLSFIIFLSSCGGGGISAKTVSFAEGTFVRDLHDEYTTGKDTLEFHVLDASGGTYSVSQRSTYVQTHDGKKLPEKHEESKWTGVYDEEHHQVRVQSKELAYTFLPDKGMVVTGGGTEYKKVQ